MAGPLLSQTQQQRMQLVLAPQLRQSLELLQVPTLEMRSLIQQELEQNPTLEELIAENDHVEVETPQLEPKDEAAKDFGEEYEMLAQLDDEWQAYFRESAPRGGGGQEADARRKHQLDSISQPESLQEHLLHQLALTDLPQDEMEIGQLVIGHIDEDGYLATPLEELASSSGREISIIEKVHQDVREFEPIGVGSRDLKDCLLFQIQREGKAGTNCEAVVRDHLEDLGAHHYAAIAKALKISSAEVQAIARHIATLEPRPGRRFSPDDNCTVLPEVFVQKVDGKYVVSLNDEQLPHLRISKHYRSLMESPETTPEVKNYIMEKIRSGAFLIKSIHQRQRTIRMIATELVNVQQEFMDKGVKFLRPLTMAEVSSVLGIHETTVSRAVFGKYMQTPQGVYEMKYFFTPGYKTAAGGSVSNATIKDRIQTLIAEEDRTSPRSDQALADLLKEEGVVVARRTVAKYREELKILPSSMRRTC